MQSTVQLNSWRYVIIIDQAKWKAIVDHTGSNTLKIRVFFEAIVQIV